jgi:predicted XRE-type DNA-binding protein
MGEIVQGGTNVYVDSGCPDADEMLLKARLVSKIREIIGARQWTQRQASTVLGISQPRLSEMLNGRFRGISEVKLLECLNRLGRDVHIVIGPARMDAAAANGRLEVVFA